MVSRPKPSPPAKSAGRKSQGRKSDGRRRSLRFESMEARQMLAGDLGEGLETAPSLTTAAISPATSFQVSSFQASAGDAGSTRATAHDLGALDGTESLNGRVSFRDTLDVFQFEIERDAEVDLDLHNLRRNADLFVVDASGQWISGSRNAGRSSEELTLDLEAGTYFVGVQARSLWGSSYRLDINAELAPLLLAEPEPVPIPDIPDSLPPASDTIATTPFSDVSYFGGRLDWNVNAVNAPEAWAAGYTGEGILVAVVDTGVDLDHPDLVNSIYVNPGEIAGDGIDNDGNGYIDDVNGYDFASRDADPNDVGGHGTHVAGTIAAGNNGFGSTGIAHGASILPVRVLGSNGSGSTSAVAAGIRYAADMGADIINLSLGGDYSRAIAAAITYARELGSFIVAAAGNEAASVPGYPARFSANNSNVISVGAHNQSDRIAGFSNDVGRSGSVQIDAPGVGVYSTYVGGRYASLSGTSMASPHVAGVAALALSANPNLAPEELRSLLVGGVTDSAIGSDALGQLNAATTVAFAARGFTNNPSSLTAAGTSTSNAFGNANGVRATGTVAVIADSSTSDSNHIDEAIREEFGDSGVSAGNAKKASFEWVSVSSDSTEYSSASPEVASNDTSDSFNETLDLLVGGVRSVS